MASSDMILLTVALGGLGLIVYALLAFAKGPSAKDAAVAADDAADELRAAAKRAAKKGKGKRGGLAASAARRAAEDGDGAADVAAGDGSDGEGGSDREGDDDDDENLTDKEWRKREQKRERAAERAAAAQAADAKAKKADKRNEKYREKEEARLAQEAEDLAQAQAEAEKAAEKAQAEFDDWKGMFATEDAGEDAADEAKTEDLLAQFVEHVKTNKVVVVEDLAAKFEMTTKDALDRIKDLEEVGRLTGLVDDRGKYISLEDSELAAVAEWIKGRGRVSVADLAEASNRLVALDVEKGDDEAELDWGSDAEDGEELAQ